MTPAAFVPLCDMFIYTGIMNSALQGPTNMKINDIKVLQTMSNAERNKIVSLYIFHQFINNNNHQSGGTLFEGVIL